MLPAPAIPNNLWPYLLPRKLDGSEFVEACKSMELDFPDEMLLKVCVALPIARVCSVDAR